jgi:hypothetical protein
MGLENYITSGRGIFSKTASALSLAGSMFLGTLSYAQDDMPRFADPPVKPGVSKIDNQKADKYIPMSPPPGYESRDREYSEKCDLKDLETAVFHEEDWARIYTSRDEAYKQQFEKDWMSKTKKERESIIYALSESLSYVENRFSDKEQNCIEKITNAYKALERASIIKNSESGKDYDENKALVSVFKKGVSLEEVQKEYSKEYLGLVDLSRPLGRSQLIMIYEHEKKNNGLKRLNPSLFKSYKMDY